MHARSCTVISEKVLPDKAMFRNAWTETNSRRLPLLYLRICSRPGWTCILLFAEKRKHDPQPDQEILPRKKKEFFLDCSETFQPLSVLDVCNCKPFRTKSINVITRKESTQMRMCVQTSLPFRSGALCAQVGFIEICHFRKFIASN